MKRPYGIFEITKLFIVFKSTDERDQFETACRVELKANSIGNKNSNIVTFARGTYKEFTQKKLTDLYDHEPDLPTLGITFNGIKASRKTNSLKLFTMVRMWGFTNAYAKGGDFMCAGYRHR